MQQYSSFSYKPGNSIVHKMPAWIKLLILPTINILFFCLPFYFSIGFILFQFLIFFLLKFSFRDIFSDLKIVLYYAVILYLFGFIGNFCGTYFPQFSSEYIGEAIAVSEGLKISAEKNFANKETLEMLLKILCIMQSTSILFKTSTSLEIREGVGTIESAVRKFFHLPKKNSFTNMISLFLCFIPMVFKIYGQIKMAWYARGGKHNLKMYMTIFPVLFSVGMKKAYNQAKAIAVRS